jgi:N-acetylglucosamine-6-phosphate deacetylase
MSVESTHRYAIRGTLALGGSLEEGAVVVEGERIAAVSRSTRDGDLPAEIIEAEIVSPGFIDLQVNGGFGVEIDADPESFRLVSRKLPESGVTSYLPTVISSFADHYGGVFAAFDEAGGCAGARALGVHLEGPFLAAARKGAHPIAAIEQGSDALFEQFLNFPETRLVTLAAERPGNPERIQRLRERGIIVSLGHTDATIDELTAAVDAGAVMATHLYNAMSPFGHREPGVIGAVLTEDRLVAGLIADGVHAHPRAVTLAIRAKGTDRIALVTDLMAAAGMPPGDYTLGGQLVSTDGVAARLPDGTLAGAVLLMNEAIRNAATWGNVTIAQAIRMATEVPGRLLGRDDIGQIRPGARADLVLLDRDLDVMRTVIGGETLFRHSSSG